ncbi:hypothetical protein [Rhodovulum visakhapatnamense]|uniref:Uncharacterized protein n=1 Tax=Rhodovulum visakhapatnamense TaxID=364297 RepID=A0A4R8FCE6_9RHOB|nr:hypothetical protein [Rhodovulum visakhapatnamense]TDX23366.1 hypothetical protein EV657_12616 [Rhodovulum visakhapatnamense]
MTPVLPAAAAALALCLSPGATRAQDLLEEYVAIIGPQDLYNSKGARLTAPWQVLRQDRANFHRFGRRDPGDRGDRFFASAENRGAMEQMVMRGSIDPAAARDLMAGGATVVVRIWGQNGRGDRVTVGVSR